MCVLLFSLFALLTAFLNTTEAMDVEAFLKQHGDLRTAIKKELDDQFEKGNVYRGETLEMILAILFSVNKDTKKYTPLPHSPYPIRATSNGMLISPDEVRAEIKAFINHAVGTPPGPDAALRAVVVGNVAYEECKDFLEKTLTIKVGTQPSAGQNKPGKHHGDVHDTELELLFKVALLHHETPEVADAAAHFHKIGGAIPNGTANITPKNRVTPNGYIPDNEPNIYRSEIRGALESSRNLRNHDLNGIAHAALERAEKELGEAKKKLEQLNAKFSSK